MIQSGFDAMRHGSNRLPNQPSSQSRCANQQRRQADVTKEEELHLERHVFADRIVPDRATHRQRKCCASCKNQQNALRDRESVCASIELDKGENRSGSDKRNRCNCKIIDHAHPVLNKPVGQAAIFERVDALKFPRVKDVPRKLLSLFKVVFLDG